MVQIGDVFHGKKKIHKRISKVIKKCKKVIKKLVIPSAATAEKS